jgi:hypothetical protein
MLDTLKQYYKTATDKYFIAMNYVENKELIERQLIIYKEGEEGVDYTQDPAKATIFGFVLGSLVVSELRSKCKDLPNLQFDLVSVGDAMFIHDVTGGPKKTEEKETAAV